MEIDADTPSALVPYTVVFCDVSRTTAADLAHAAPLPRVGDRVEYIDESAQIHRYTVREVIHTLQLAAEARPEVSSHTQLPAAMTAADEEDKMSPEGTMLRAGLPRIVLEAV